jgi:hypothetical protein
MSDVWRIFQSRLAATLGEQLLPAESWRHRRRTPPAWFSPPPLPPLIGGDHGRAGQLVRLPGIQRPQCGPGRVRTR